MWQYKTGASFPDKLIFQAKTTTTIRQQLNGNKGNCTDPITFILYVFSASTDWKKPRFKCFENYVEGKQSMICSLQESCRAMRTISLEYSVSRLYQKPKISVFDRDIRFLTHSQPWRLFQGESKTCASVKDKYHKQNDILLWFSNLRWLYHSSRLWAALDLQ